MTTKIQAAKILKLLTAGKTAKELIASGYSKHAVYKIMGERNEKLKAEKELPLLYKDRDQQIIAVLNKRNKKGSISAFHQFEKLTCHSRVTI